MRHKPQYCLMKRSAIWLCLIAALPIECVNFLLMPPIDIGPDPKSGWYIKLFDYLDVYLHWPGFLLIFQFEHSQAIHRLAESILFASGYIDTVILLSAGLFLSRWSGQSFPTTNSLIGEKSYYTLAAKECEPSPTRLPAQATADTTRSIAPTPSTNTKTR